MPSRKIVHVLGSFHVGGAEQVALDLARLQVREGHRVHVVSLAAGEHGPNAVRFHEAGVTIVSRPKRGPSVDPSLPLRLALYFKRVGADVVHSHNPLPLIYCSAAAAMARLPLVHTKHGANKTAGSERLRRYARFGVSALVAVAEQTAVDAREQGEVPPSGVQVIENGIDLDSYGVDADVRRDVRRELSIPDDVPVIGTVGRLIPLKNQSLLVRACAPLLDRAHLVVIGDGPSRETLERDRSNLGDNAARVHLLGRRMDVPRLLTALDVFALTSDNEGLPLVLPEAMAMRLPVVATRVGGIPKVVEEGATGLLVPAGDQAAVTDALKTLLDDPGLAERMGDSGREVALARFSARAMCEKYDRVYESVMAS